MQRAASVDAEHDIFRQVSIFVDEEHDSFSRMGFTICDRRTLTIEARDMSMRLPIPEGGLQNMDIFNISSAFGRVRIPWLVTQLNNPFLEGAAGPYVAELATLYEANLDRVADLFIRAHQHTTPNRPLQLHPVEAPLPDDFCVVCQHTSTSENWVSIEGCTRHRFHRECVEGQFRGGNCMLCRAPLRPQQ